jgi:hypothetical protein
MRFTIKTLCKQLPKTLKTLFLKKSKTQEIMKSTPSTPKEQSVENTAQEIAEALNSAREHSLDSPPGTPRSPSPAPDAKNEKPLNNKPNQPSKS